MENEIKVCYGVERRKQKLDRYSQGLIHNERWVRPQIDH